MTEAMSDMNASNRTVIDQYRANDGVVEGWEQAPLLRLTTTGAKSATERTTPIVCTHDGDRIIVIASRGGAPKHRAWYHNLVAHPDATVELGTEKFTVHAEVTAGEERDQLYRAQADLMANFDEYQQKTTPVIPVVALTDTS
jgi:deazaflavin-dependent oxidoreductase (nitroreductase family)